MGIVRLWLSRPGARTDGVTRPVVDPDYTATVGLDRDQARALIDADADTGPRALRTSAVIRLLATTALRGDEVTSADVTDLGTERGHRVVRVVRKGGGKARLPLPPATWSALEAYLSDRANRAGMDGPEGWRRLDGPPLATDTDGRMRKATCGNWSAASPAPPGWSAGPSCRRTACATPPSPSPRPRRRCPAARCAGLRRAQGSPHHPTLRPHPTQPRPQRRLHPRGVPHLISLRGGKPSR